MRGKNKKKKKYKTSKSFENTLKSNRFRCWMAKTLEIKGTIICARRQIICHI